MFDDGKVGVCVVFVLCCVLLCFVLFVMSCFIDLLCYSVMTYHFIFFRETIYLNMFDEVVVRLYVG